MQKQTSHDIMIDPHIKQQFLSEVKQAIPERQIYTDSLRTYAWGTDASFYRMTPQVVVRTKNSYEESVQWPSSARYSTMVHGYAGFHP